VAGEIAAAAGAPLRADVSRRRPRAMIETAEQKFGPAC
jgi:hypothetical protein